MNFEKPKKSEFQKNEKILLEISSFYKCTKYQILKSFQVQFLRYSVRQFLCHFRPFSALYPPPPTHTHTHTYTHTHTPPKLKFWKNEKKTYRHHFTQVYHKLQSYAIWFLRYARQVFLLSRAIFCPFTPLTASKTKNFKKMKKTPGDIIILHKCTKTHDHMLYWFWDIACDGYNCYFSFWANFCPFTSLTVQKMKIKKKNTWRYHHFTQVYQKSWLYAILFSR